ncbi:MAG: flagellar FlbD family protein [Ilumatobacter sp.]|jgi:uncharacterized protein YlzI (FlbEa/FlbD family)|uniref:flagellar FlbD family protein n=1 Tax=Ilumatobacter sp. TaxID=1967498 RepID=UPI00391AA52D
MIPLTRLRHGDSFYLNPDYIERVDSYVDTVVRLITGVEYVVQEPADEITRRIIAYRSSILAAVPAAAPFVANLPYEAIAATSVTVGTIILENEAP